VDSPLDGGQLGRLRLGRLVDNGGAVAHHPPTDLTTIQSAGCPHCAQPRGDRRSPNKGICDWNHEPQNSGHALGFQTVPSELLQGTPDHNPGMICNHISEMGLQGIVRVFR